ncbi:BspC domain-containing protein [Mycoavidus sp. B2-EB]|uniref:BspC domain-containing protein n=1 Tax=Mycoavidus sp. B2-EB TaxID=2651972 RepID=UPI0016257036|nr:hypothetical protein [Mycoavidus sp. B2-EB]BBO60008.1 hypothetical protein MPB2EB_1143 [Mycoavidus sp. B2-EB]
MQIIVLLVGCLMLLLPLPSHAGRRDEHLDLVKQFITQQQATPLVADCAAHASFVVTTLPLYTRIEFPDGALDNGQASLLPWHQPFNNKKQRVKVDTIVSISGVGYRKAERSKPDVLEFRCGYLANQLLAFDYNEPKPASVKRKTAAPVKSTHQRQSTSSAH